MENKDIVVLNQQTLLEIYQDWSQIKIYRTEIGKESNPNGIPIISIPVGSSEKAKAFKDGFLLAMKLVGKQVAQKEN